MPEGAERLLRDVHPVEVTVGGRAILAARAFVTTDRVVVYRERVQDGRRRPEIALSAALTGDRPRADRSGLTGTLTIETSEGDVIVNRGRGCGCGSTLKLVGPLAAW